MRVLFISRKYPPSVGGMEKLSYHLVESARARPGVKAEAIVWRYSQKFLPLFIMIALLQSVRICLKGIDVIHIGDPVLSLLGFVLKALFHVPIVITVHGLDLIYPLSFYQLLVPHLVKRYDRVICISRAIQEICLERGIDPKQCQVIRPGVDVPEMSYTKIESRRSISQWLRDDLSESKLIVTVGRLVPRKGVYFFVKNVLPELVREDKSFVYIVIGEGPDRKRILTAIAEQNLQQHVLLTGYVNPRLLQTIYKACDLFVAPNITQPNDVEGFGLVVLEAAATGCPVLVADLEGLKDTIPESRSDWLVPAGDALAWSSKIRTLFQTPERLERWGIEAQKFVLEHFAWRKMGDEYLQVFEECADNAGP